MTESIDFYDLLRVIGFHKRPIEGQVFNQNLTIELVDCFLRSSVENDVNDLLLLVISGKLDNLEDHMIMVAIK